MKNSKIAKIFITIFSLCLFWLTFGLLMNWNKNYNSEKIKVPTGFETVYIFQSSKLIKNTLHRLTFDSNYQFLYLKLRNLITNPNKDEKNVKRSGIDFLSPIVYAENSRQHCKIIVVRLTSKKDFKQTFKNNKYKTRIIDNLGIIYLSNPNNPVRFQTIKITNNHDLVGLENGKENFTVDIEGNKIHLEGRMITKIKSSLTNLPERKGFQFQIPLSNQMFQNTQLQAPYNKWLSMIEMMAVDYQGTTIQAGEIYPHFNAVIKTKEELPMKEIDSLFRVKLHTQLRKISGNTYSLSLQKQVYYLSHLHKNEWFIGIDTTSIISKSDNVVFEINGKPSFLTKISGNIFMSAAVNLIPGFAQTKEFLNKVQDIDITVKKAGGENLTIKGTLSMKEKRDFSLEFVNYLLELQQ